MIIKILKTSSSTREAMDYSEKKVMAGLSTAVAVYNIYSNDPATIADTLNEYVPDNISKQTRMAKRPILHFTAGPGPEDTDVEEDIITFIAEYLDFIGFKDQPAVIYKHFDIDRPHYHIVTPRFDKNGVCLSPHFPVRETTRFIRENGPKYGIFLGRESSQALIPDRRSVRRKFFRPESENKAETFRALFEYALQFNCRSLSDFAKVMESMGVKFTTKPSKKFGMQRVCLQGVDKRGQANTEVMGFEQTMGGTAYSRVIDTLPKYIKQLLSDIPEEIKLSVMCEQLTKKAPDSRTFQAMLDQLGMRAYFTRETVKRKGKNEPPIKDVCLVDVFASRVYSGETLRTIFPVRLFVELESSGRWSAERAIIESRQIPAKPLSKDDINGINAEIKNRMARYREQLSVSPNLKISF